MRLSLRPDWAKFRFLSIALLVLASVSGYSTALADPSHPLFPNFQSDREKAAYFLWLDETYPTLLDHTTSYETDLFGMLENEKAIIAQLRTMNSLPDKRVGEILTIFATSKTAAPPATHAGRSFAWSPELKAQFEVYLHSGGYKGAMIGLINLVPPAERKAIFAMPSGDALNALREKLPNDVINAGFDPRSHKLEAVAHDKTELLKILAERMVSEEHMLVKANAELVAFGTEHRIVIREEIYKQWFDEGLNQLGFPTGDARAMEDVRKSLKKFLTTAGSFGDEHVVLNEVKRVVMRLKEVPSHVGVFRGWAGGDCSSSYSYAYPWSPRERVFFVYDHEDRIKGYLSGTVVTTGGGAEDFYIHTINGKISEDDAVLLLKSVHAARGDLGFRRVVVPLETQTNSIVNSAPIRQAFAKFRTASRQVSVQYLDGTIRTYMNGLVRSSTYDSAEKNNTGFFIDDSLDRGIAAPIPTGSDLKVERSVYEWLPAKTDRINAAQLYLQKSVSIQTNNVYLRDKIGGFLKIEAAVEQRWNGLFANVGTLPFDVYLEKVKEWFTEQGLRYDEYQKRIEPIMLDGMQRCPDVFDGAAGRRRRLKVIGYLTEASLNSRAVTLINTHIEKFDDAEIERIVKLALTENERTFDIAKIEFLTNVHPRVRARWNEIFENSRKLPIETFRGRVHDWLGAQGLDVALYEGRLSPILQKAYLECPDFFVGGDGNLRLNEITNALIEPVTRAETIQALGKRFERLGNSGYDRIIKAALPVGGGELDDNLLDMHEKIADRFDEIFSNSKKKNYAVYKSTLTAWQNANGVSDEMLNSHAMRDEALDALVAAPDAFTSAGSLDRFRSFIPDFANEHVATVFIGEPLNAVADQLTPDDVARIFVAFGHPADAHVPVLRDFGVGEMSALTSGGGHNIFHRLHELMKTRNLEAEFVSWASRTNAPALEHLMYRTYSNHMGLQARFAHFERVLPTINSNGSLRADLSEIFFDGLPENEFAQISFDDIARTFRIFGNGGGALAATGDLDIAALYSITEGYRRPIDRIRNAIRERGPEMEPWFKNWAARSRTPILDHVLYLTFKDHLSLETRLAHFERFLGAVGGNNRVQIEKSLLFSSEFFGSKEGNRRLLGLLERLKDARGNEVLISGLPGLNITTYYNAIKKRSGVFPFADLYGSIEKDISLMKPESRAEPLASLVREAPDLESFLGLMKKIGSTAVYDRGFIGPGRKNVNQRGMIVDGSTWIAQNFYQKFAALGPRIDQIAYFLANFGSVRDLNKVSNVIRTFAENAKTEKDLRALEKILSPFREKLIKLDKQNGAEQFAALLRPHWDRVRGTPGLTDYFVGPLSLGERCRRLLRSPN